MSEEQTFEERRAAVHEEYWRGRITEERCTEMLRELARLERAAENEARDAI